ncbi:MAG: serine/threonine-protein kinase [Gemmataceae bacterium]
MIREDGTQVEPVLDTVRDVRRHRAERPDPVTSALSDTTPTLLAAVSSAVFEFRPGMVLGTFVLVRQIGQGGMGQVWEADDTRLPRKVAVKVMRPDLAGNLKVRERFVREAGAQARVLHPHVVPLYQIGDHGGIPYFVMPLLRGETLADRLRREGSLPLAELLRIGREIAEGLEAAHKQGLIHRDVKPGNVWLNEPDGTVLLLDFGIARSPDMTAGSDPITSTGMLLGTPAYMAPEQAAGQKVDARADLFSLGVLLYEMATDVQPFRSDSVYSTLTALATVQPPSAIVHRADLPPVLCDLIGRLLEKKPADRWPTTAGELASLLRRLESSEAEMVGLPPRPQPRRRSYRWLAVVLPLLLSPAAYFAWRVMTPAPVVQAPTPDERLREFVAQLREQPIEHCREGVNKNGLLVNIKQNKLRFTGVTGVPVCSDLEGGKAVVSIGYDGTYIRDILQIIGKVNETKTLGGVIRLTVTVDDTGVHVTGREVTDTHGEVTDTHHDGQRCALAAVMALVNRVAPPER